ncbi:cytochrome P450 4C1 [Tribolium castaneum]|uniref:Cytochrome P450 4d2-like Protein n=1 Tax=Tribolium castaneum TaxID=7070 RepID=A0A139WKB4_TRICA|nr:PREDICTED: cytochrome P450 4C1-like [Tribolium castaneum]KYB28488.1 Cytochrome P450 4d2-like Protein [Tribolium castaneum]|eukprot:XP_015833766.1 PREDICTED: cytochrome P450 4C1-like [Tribolium castaneum]
MSLYSRKYKPICKFWVLGQLIFWVSHPKYVEIILNKCLEKERSYKYLEVVLGRGLFTIPANKWKKRRQVIESILDDDLIDSFAQIFKDYSDILLKKLGKFEGQYVDVMPIMTQFSLDIMFSTILGTKVNALDEDTKIVIGVKDLIESIIKRLSNIMLRPNLFWKLLYLSQKSEELDRRIDHYFRTALKSRRCKSTTGGKVFLDFLLNQTDENWTDDELLAETRTLIIAGTDAIATATSFCLVMLAMHPEIQDRLYNETGTAYLECVIKETLRLFPTYSFIGRELDEDVVLGRYTLPKGSSVVVPLLDVQRSQKYWPQALEFKPDRFLPPKRGYFPFSVGPRNCLGREFALKAMKILLSNLLRTFQITETPFKSISDIKVSTNVVTRSFQGCMIKLQPR